MAEPVVSFVLERLGELIINEAIDEARFLHGVGDQFEEAKRELQRMRCFLKDADRYVSQGDERVRNWVFEITDVAYDLEDIVATFALREAISRRAGSKCVLRFTCIFNKGIKLHQVGSKIEKISTRLSKLTCSLQTYGLRELKDNTKGALSSSNERQIELRRSYSHVAELDIVGFEGSTKELLAHLTKEGDPVVQVVSICGMGGLGKTTLAKMVYRRCRQVTQHFDCFAWAYVSQQYQRREIWEGILVKLISPTKDQREEITKMKEDEVAKKLYEVLQEKKCLVVLDDIWTTISWDDLEAAFPKNETNSKIMITTRRKDVAFHADRNCFLYEPPRLDDNESWELLEKRAYVERDGTSPRDYERKKALGQNMLKHCVGLPLAIVVLGGLLSTKHTIDEWETLYENVKAYINKGKDQDQDEQEYQGVSWVLGLSYDELPYHLKPCFLHLAHFPEDYEIKVKQLCKIWIAEGFIPMGQQRHSSTETMEDAAYKCLTTLVDRCMVQVGEQSSILGRIKTCRMHDLMREMCVLKAQEENFLRIISFQRQRHDEATDSNTSGMFTLAMPSCKVRRLAIYSNKNIVDDLLPLIKTDECLRSLICFTPEQSVDLRQVMKPLLNCFLMLRVLKFEHLERGHVEMLPKEIGKLIHLRLLSLRNSQVQQLPSSISDLQCLQTLDLQTDYFFLLRPKSFKTLNVISKLKQLRHLYLPAVTSNDDYHNKLPLASLNSLQTLVNFSTDYCELDDLSHLSNLRKLKIFAYINLGQAFKPGSNNNLQSLVVKNLSTSKLNLTTFLSSCNRIQKLFLQGELVKLPEHNQFSPLLVKLTLEGTELGVDPMTTLGMLPKLRILRLIYDAFIGNEMVCLEGGFPQLESLSLVGLSCFTKWSVEEGTLLSLRHLQFEGCSLLKLYPSGLRDITTLKEVVIENMPQSFLKSFEEGGPYSSPPLPLPLPPPPLLFLPPLPSPSPPSSPPSSLPSLSPLLLLQPLSSTSSSPTSFLSCKEVVIENMPQNFLESFEEGGPFFLRPPSSPFLPHPCPRRTPPLPYNSFKQPLSSSSSSTSPSPSTSLTLKEVVENMPQSFLKSFEEGGHFLPPPPPLSFLPCPHPPLSPPIPLFKQPLSSSSSSSFGPSSSTSQWRLCQSSPMPLPSTSTSTYEYFFSIEDINKD